MLSTLNPTTTRDYGIKEIKKPNVSNPLKFITQKSFTQFGKNVFCLRDYINAEVLSKLKMSPDVFNEIDACLVEYERFVRYDNNGNIPNFAKKLVDKICINVKTQSNKRIKQTEEQDQFVEYNGKTYKIIRRK